MIRKIAQRMGILFSVLAVIATPLVVATPVFAEEYQCGEVKTYFNWGCDSGADGEGMIKSVLKTILKIVGIALPVVCIAYISFGGLMMATAGGDKAKSKRGIEMIRNAIIAIIVYAVAYALLNWLLPGGLQLKK